MGLPYSHVKDTLKWSSNPLAVARLVADKQEKEITPNSMPRIDLRSSTILTRDCACDSARATMIEADRDQFTTLQSRGPSFTANEEMEETDGIVKLYAHMSRCVAIAFVSLNAI